MQLNEKSAEQRLADLGMDDMPVMPVQVRPATVSSDWFPQYKKLCRRFMETLTDSVSELAFLNLNQNEFISLIMGRAMPDNLSIRFRVPLIWGGELKTENLFLCQTFPHSQKLDQFIMEQSGNEIIWLPNPTKNVYVPAHTAGGGDGGNATSDRLSQLAAQIVAARGMEQ